MPGLHGAGIRNSALGQCTASKALFSRPNDLRFALRFAPGSATPVDPDVLFVPWAHEALADPRVRLSVVGATDGSAADVDPVTHSAVVLAADRARAAAALIGPAAVDRLILSTAAKPGQRIAMVTLVFAGEPSRRHQ